ncbi:MAG: sigma-70 family RNA polymerase sigma factor [Chitinophagaceae bacterium]
MDLKSTYKEVELVGLLKQKDHHGFIYLYDRCAPAIYTSVLQIIKQEETSQQVVQDVFIKVWLTIDNYDPARERLFTWILQIAREAAFDKMSSGNDRQFPTAVSTAEDGISDLVTRSAIDNYGLKNLILELNEEQKVLIELCYYKGLTNAEIAEKLGIPSETVKTKIKIALCKLRNSLELKK